ncbi:hypothetical protein KB976_004993 [Vibrio parahaemolyticus]|nr:hypothetical protein [Vibrio parahaemolyticus]
MKVDVFKALASCSSTGMNNYSDQYMDSVREIAFLSTNPRLLTSHIKAKEYADAESMLRFSLIFNDLSQFTWAGGRELAIVMLQPEWFERQFGAKGALVNVSAERLAQLGLDEHNPQIMPGFVFPHGKQADKILSDLRPFIERGKLLIQPDRALFHTKEGSNTWESINVSQYSTLDTWRIEEEAVSRPIPICFESNDHIDQASMFDITIPYLEGVNFPELAKILDDEGDLISGLRVSIKEALSECGDGVDPRVVAKDVIDPKVDALNRKFRSIINTHSFRVAGAGVGTVALAYTAVSTGGLSSALATVCGSGGLGLLGKEYSAYREKVNELKNDPYYFLWRCKKVKKNT